MHKLNKENVMNYDIHLERCFNNKRELKSFIWNCWVLYERDNHPCKRGNKANPTGKRIEI